MNKPRWTMVVDADKCVGVGQCEMLEEDTFYLDDDTGIAVVIGATTLSGDRADAVIEKCPSSAIGKTR